MAGRDDGVSLGEGEVIRGTDKALLVRLDDVGEEKWIPKSVIHADSEVFDESNENGIGNVVVMAWWAEKEGLV
jgi:hypothetical protein